MPFCRLPDVKSLAIVGIIRYNAPMSDIAWNSVTIGDDEKPQISMEDLRELAADLDPDDFDEPVQEFLEELMKADDVEELQKASTLLLQDEIDFSPELAAMGIEPDEGLITLLIATGADVNALNAYGQSPLHLAAQYGYANIVDMLLTAGAKLTVRNHGGKLPADMTEDAALKERLTPAAATMEDMPMPEGFADSVFEHLHSEASCDCGCHHEGGEHECSCGHCH